MTPQDARPSRVPRPCIVLSVFIAAELLLVAAAFGLARLLTGSAVGGGMFALVAFAILLWANCIIFDM